MGAREIFVMGTGPKKSLYNDKKRPVAPPPPPHREKSSKRSPHGEKSTEGKNIGKRPPNSNIFLGDFPGFTLFKRFA